MQKTERNNSAGKPYYTQRNNQIKPASACNVTSMVLALSAADWPVECFATEGEQPEDALMRFISIDPLTLQKWKQIDPQGKIPPEQWHVVLAFGTNRFLRSFGIDTSPVTFREAVSREEIVAAIDTGGAAVISGRFPQEGKEPLDHIVAVVGYGTDGGGFYFIIDDPWGDYHGGYKNHQGKSIRMPLEDFDGIAKPPGQVRKWAHIIRSFDR